jgi:hypothetical protein
MSFASVAVLGCLLGLASGCWYDSRWGQAKAAQRRIAQKTAPADIRTAPADGDDADGGARTGARRTYRVRLRPNEHYLTQTVDARRQLSNVIDDANGVLIGVAGLELQIDATTPWSFDADAELPRALEALRRDDPGQDVDLVVGLVGSLPLPTDSFHEVGYAEILGTHAVLRAASRISDQSEIDRAFTELTADEREHLVQRRKRHRALAVFLHELGHLLGALHEGSTASLMHPTYDPKMNSFGSGAVTLMRLAVDTKDRPALVEAQLEYLRGAPGEDWSPGEREQEITALQAKSAAYAQRAAAASVQSPPPPADDAPPELQGADRERFIQAWAIFRVGGIAPAYETAKPLFATYPKSIRVQDLRCQLATVRHLESAEMVAECVPYSRLAASSDGGS